MASEVLSVAIGVVFVFMLFALFLSASLEAISAALKLRGRALRVALAKLIDDPDKPVKWGGFGLVDQVMPAKAPGELVADPVDLEAPERHEATFADGDHKPLEPLRFADVFCHPLVAGASGSSKPSYVPEGHFTSAVLQALLQAQPQASVDAVAARVALLPPGPVKTALQGALLDAQGNWEALRAGIDRWYANAMDRLSGEYKRFSQLITFVLGLVLAASFNIDAIALARQLYADPALRETLAQQASAYVAEHPPAAASAPADAASAPDAQARYDAAVAQWLAARDLLTRTVPGASSSAEMPTAQRVREGWLGWLITALAGMLGAPFWFDLLQKLTNLRGTGPKPASSTDAK